MARTVMQFSCSNAQLAAQKISTILAANNYKPIIEKGENVWKCGVGFWTAMKYVKFEFASENTVVVSGWIRAVIGGECDLNGTAGMIPKKQVLKILNQIQTAIM